MSLNEILGSAMSGLAASQAGMRSVSNNIANVGTAGYARERVSLSTGVTSGRVSGVVIGEPERVADKFLEGAVYRRAGDIGRAEAAASYMDRLQSLLGAPGVESGLAARLTAISTSASEMTGLQGSAQAIARFTGNVQDTITQLNQLDRDVSGLRADIETELGYTLERSNILLRQIHDLNDEVARLEGLGRSSAGAADRRMIALEELSGLMKVNVREQADGRVTIDTASGQVLLDRRLRQLSYPGGSGASQPTYPPIDIRFADADGNIGAATGEKIDSAAVGGKLGGLIDLRDRALPEFSEKLGVLFTGLAESLNAVSNAGTTLPPPASLVGRESGLIGTDRLGFTGAATFAVLGNDGTLIAKTTVDFTALGAAATVDDAITAINAGLGPNATASFVNGQLSISATAPNTGVAIAQDPTNPSSRAGLGFSQFFGLNDIIRSDSSALVPSGLIGADPHGFGPGETAEIVLRDASGRTLTSYTLTGSAGPNYGDLVTELNASPLGAFGSFAIDGRGRIQFQSTVAATGATISIPSDSTNRYGTGRSFSTLSGLSGDASGLSNAEVRPDILASTTRLPLARLQLGAAVGEKAIGAGDVTGATAFVDQLAKAVDLGKDGSVTVERFSSLLLGRAGTQAAQAQSAFEDASARMDDAVSRRDSFAGVNVDEELAQMVVLQNSYSAAARVMTTASEMYDTLIGMLN
ncbi:flagellar hook-associated protein FlgK [Sphingomonas sp. LaA6.9]|uniref:flagellar hook-associated protein FlgK n=1 Tax=Sphingomonas sp. LaA6.9 TaxID=2919914 RepID=UPI001F4FB3CF|nr:flagellar basal body rod C-terminal domain-containing protein [Sphingomonas sp. LaA6.9]MCJ8157719.1 flagellar biosynthesis protein FlgK [Sphingomonas sp. LaA6.9]